MDNDLCVCCKRGKSNPAYCDQDAFFHSHKASDKSGTFEKILYGFPLLTLVEDSAIDIWPEFFSAEGAPVDQDIGQPPLPNLSPVLIA
jgi:hypothetical protein